MNKKIKIVLTIVAMLSLANCALAYTYSWCSSSGDWADPARWDVMPSPSVLGGAYIWYGATLNVTTPGQGACDCAIGYDPGWDGQGLHGPVQGTVNVAQDIEWIVTGEGMVGHAGGIGVLNVYGTARISRLRVSSYAAASSGTINVYSGGKFITGSPGGTVLVGEVAPAAINLKGTGSMEVVSWPLSLNDGLGHIDLEAGYLKVWGDYSGVLEYYVNSGWITSHNGENPRCVPVVSVIEGNTYVKSTCTCETYLTGDLNHDCFIDTIDLDILTQNWLSCINPSDSNCVQY